MKYARSIDGRLVDVTTVPVAHEVDPAAWLAVQFPTLSGWVSVPDDTENSAVDNGDGTYTNPVEPTPAPTPRVLSITDFNKFCWSKLGMAAFQKILEATKNSTGTSDAELDARAAITQYDKALTVAKSEVEAIGYKILLAGFMTQDQFDAVTGSSWPEAGMLQKPPILVKIQDLVSAVQALPGT